MSGVAPDEVSGDEDGCVELAKVIGSTWARCEVEFEMERPESGVTCAAIDLAIKRFRSGGYAACDADDQPSASRLPPTSCA
eukprot:1034394-Pleurochrysis_carterae.AAC.1